MEPVIEVKNLKKYFPTANGILHAVDDVSLTIHRGKTLGVVGESGCGNLHWEERLFIYRSVQRDRSFCLEKISLT